MESLVLAHDVARGFEERAEEHFLNFCLQLFCRRFRTLSEPENKSQNSNKQNKPGVALWASLEPWRRKGVDEKIAGRWRVWVLFFRKDADSVSAGDRPDRIT